TRWRRASSASAAMSETLAPLAPVTMASVARSVDGVVGSEGVAGDHRGVAPGAALAAPGGCLLLVVLLLDVDLPDVVGGAGGDVLGGEHGRVHRVVLVVVPVHAVAAHRVHVRRAVLQPLAHALHVGLVALVVEGVR